MSSENKSLSIKAVQKALKEEEMTNGHTEDEMNGNGNSSWNNVEQEAEAQDKLTVAKKKKKRAKSVDLNAAPPSAVSKASKNSEPKETKPRKKHSEDVSGSKDKKRYTVNKHSKISGLLIFFVQGSKQTSIIDRNFYFAQNTIF